MQVISFFSFKGGVGRTGLLTNVGAQWAREGKVVLLIDLDLSACRKDIADPAPSTLREATTLVHKPGWSRRELISMLSFRSMRRWMRSIFQIFCSFLWFLKNSPTSNASGASLKN